MSKLFYYQIKGKINKNNEYGLFDSNWSFPPIWSDVVQAENKKEAKTLIEEEYGRKFPLRVLQKDLDSNEFLLSVKEIQADDRLLKKRVCKACGEEFTLLQKYQVADVGGGPDYCSRYCYDIVINEERIQYHEEEMRKQLGFIYKITNKKTGMCYIGQTRQIFTLRWYQHFYQMGSCKFHEAIRRSSYVDWTFETLEVIDVGPDTQKILNERERHWIKFYDSVANGYNSI